MAIVTLRYWAAAKEAAGTAEETDTPGTLAEVLAAARGRDGADRPDGAGSQDPALRAILARSSFLIDGAPVGARAPETVLLSDAAVIEVLPPFAGG
jgi:sulfur-carrier protein